MDPQLTQQLRQFPYAGNYPQKRDVREWPWVYGAGKRAVRIIKMALADNDVNQTMEVEEVVDGILEFWAKTFDEPPSTYRTGILQDVVKMAFIEDQVVRLLEGRPVGKEERMKYRGRQWRQRFERAFAEFKTHPMPNQISTLKGRSILPITSQAEETTISKLQTIVEDMIFIDAAPPQQPTSVWWASYENFGHDFQPDEKWESLVPRLPYHSMSEYVTIVTEAWIAMHSPSW